MKRMLLTSFISLLSVTAYAMDTNSITINPRPSMQELRALVIASQGNAEWHAPVITMPTPKITVPTSKYLISPANQNNIKPTATKLLVSHQNRNEVMFRTKGQIRIFPLNQKPHFSDNTVARKYILTTPSRTNGENKELILVPYNSKRT